MDFSLLIIELIFDIALFVSGIVLIFISKDNKMKMLWGILIAFYGLINGIDSLGDLMTYDGVIVHVENTLNMAKMLRLLIYSTVFAVFPAMSLRPDLLTFMRTVIFVLPTYIITLIVICFMLFYDTHTYIGTGFDITENLNNFDVQFRLAVCVIVAIVSLTYFLTPMVARWGVETRQKGGVIKLYFWLWVVAFVISMNYFLPFSGIRFINVSIFWSACCLLFTVLFFMYENPFSRFRLKAAGQDTMTSQSIADLLFISIEEYLTDRAPFTASDYSIERLAKEVNSKQSLVVESIKSGGFTGFREYICFKRVEYFKFLAQKNRGMQIKELMYLSGFTSKSVFYRQFSFYENISPTQYVNNLYKK